MEFISILDNKLNLQKEEVEPIFFVDLNLDQVINQIQNLNLIPVKKYYYHLPADKEGEDYRRAVYTDVKNADVNAFLHEFVERVEERKQALEKKNEVSSDMQKSIWHILELAAYCEAYTKLYEGLKGAVIHSVGLQALREFLKDYVLSEDFIFMQKKALELRYQLQCFRVKLVYENEQLVVTEEAVSGTYEKFLNEAFGEHSVKMKSPFAQTMDLNDLEQEIIQKFARKHSEFFKEAKEFYNKYKEYKNKILIKFSEEIHYYLSYYTFQQKMELKGFSFTTPTVDENKDMSAQGLYDLALACTNLNSEKEVVSNDLSFCKGESFFVVTGPNQGGKTTFARSLGQLVYLSKMGLDVPATAANVHGFSGILCHFSVEESVETGRGKLMDELLRLKPMMSADCRNSFVVINELFTTAANYDACIMGKKVLEHFIAQECKGIYVTHLKELAKAHESVVSMRAMVDEKKVQTFKICRHEADESVCALNQVNKYRLSYEQLKERLG